MVKTSEILVSVIIPVYNAEKFLRECLDSVVSQSLEQIEIICVDDGSTDGSLEILKEYQSKDERILVIHQENLYAGVARQKGLDKAQGEYVCFWDADDIFDRDALEILYRASKIDNLDIAVCGHRLMDSTTKKTDIADRWSMPGSKEDVDVADNLFQVFGQVCWDKMFRREFILDNGIKFQNIKRYNDIFFVCMALCLAKRIRHIGRPLLNYRVNNGESLQGGEIVDDNICDVYLTFKDLKGSLEQLGIYEKFKRTFLNFYLDAFIDTLLRSKQYGNYERLYCMIKDYACSELETESHEAGYWYSKESLMRMHEIQNCSAEEFLLNEHRRNRERVLCGDECYRFPTGELDDVKNIVVYGAGECGKSCVRQILRSRKWKVVAWIDRNCASMDMGCIPISAPETIKDLEYDKVVIAVGNADIKCEIKESLISMEVEESRIVW